jgi:hypothetical protein
MSGWPSKSVAPIISAFTSKYQPAWRENTSFARQYGDCFMLPETTYLVHGHICYGFVTK